MTPIDTSFKDKIDASIKNRANNFREQGIFPFNQIVNHTLKPERSVSSRHRDSNSQQKTLKLSLLSVKFGQRSGKPSPLVSIPNIREINPNEKPLYSFCIDENLCIGNKRSIWGVKDCTEYCDFLYQCIVDVAKQSNFIVLNEFAFPNFVGKDIPDNLRRDSILNEFRSICKKYETFLFAGTINDCDNAEQLNQSLYGYAYGFLIDPYKNRKEDLKIFKRSHAMIISKTSQEILEGFSEYDKVQTLNIIDTPYGNIGILICADFLSMSTDDALDRADQLDIEAPMDLLIVPAMDWSASDYILRRAQWISKRNRYYIATTNSLDAALNKSKGENLWSNRCESVYFEGEKIEPSVNFNAKKNDNRPLKIDLGKKLPHAWYSNANLSVLSSIYTLNMEKPREKRKSSAEFVSDDTP